MLPIRFLKTAEADIAQGISWYHRCRQGLGADFLLCVEEALDRICHHPEAYTTIHRDIRRTLIRRFPFGVFYRLDKDYITIIAVLHCHRNPSQWQKYS